ncbi:hypothetical protein [Psychrobacter okhotskensis]|uniref:hypothetical protein n=1 Tax=Psychrobacter okhotskensis TaxID=212403 RepID=UPI001919DD9A|nr:hypothetical protein [Psychrobacter okhotskensis]
MRSTTFNYSLLALGVAAVLGMSTTANAAKTGDTTTSVDISNQASASYNVSEQEQPVVLSNIVKVTVSQQVSFSLTADNDDTAAGGVQFDDANIKEEVAPNGFAVFEHTLTNTGNLTDTYDITIGATNGKYDQGNSTISYVVYEADGTTEVRNGTVAYKEGASIPSVLEKDQSVKFAIKAKTLGNKGNETLSLELSVTSRYLADVAGVTKTLTNSNTSFTRLPTFSIVKTIRNGLDLNNLNDTAQYQIVVTNESTDFNTDATEVDIADFLPAGLVLAEPLTATNITPSSTATVGDIVASGTGDSGFNVTGNTIPVGQNITFLFIVKQGGTGTLDPENAINHVTVTDDLDNDTTTANTLVDSTDTGRELLVSDFYPTNEINNLNGQTPANTGDDSTLPLSKGGTIRRALTLTGITTREIAPTSGPLGQATHATVITNTGKDIEGRNAGELTFTITDNDGGARDAINIESGSVTVTYYPNGDDTTTPSVTAAPITAVGGVYDIYSALPSGIAPNGTVTINYKVSSIKAPLFTPSNSTTPTDEDTIVTLIPKSEGAPVQATVTDKTTVRGLTLLKTQAIDADCTGTPAAAGFVSTDIKNASPGQCIVYKIQAKNTSSTTASPTGVGFDITDVIISDELDKFSANADYVAASVTTTSGTTAVTGTAITNTIATLAPQATATMQFSVKIKTATVTP